MKARLAGLAALITCVALGIMIGRQMPHSIGVAPSPTETKLDALPSSHVESEAPARPCIVPVVTINNLTNALNQAFSERNGRRRQDALARVGDAVALADIADALQLLFRRPEPELQGLIERLLRRWTQADPAAAMACVQALPASTQRGKYIQGVLSEWAADNPTAAFQWATSHFPYRDQSVSNVLKTVAEHDPQQALALLDSLGAKSPKRALQSMILLHWAERDPAAAAQAVLQRKEVDAKTLVRLASLWAGKDPDAALSWAQSLSSAQGRRQAVGGVVQVWSATDPEAAAAFVLDQPPGTTQDDLFNKVAKQWALIDPVAAFSWATNLVAGPGRVRAMQLVLEQYAQTDPQAALALLPGLPLSHQSAVVGIIAGQWFKTDSAGAMAWAKSLPATSQAAAASAMYPQLMEQDPKEAADFVMSLSDSGIRSTMLRALASDWASQDLPSAVAWMEQLPDAQGKAKAFKGVLTDWAQADPQAAAEFWRTLALDSRDRFPMQQLARSWAADDPMQAVNWADNLPVGREKNAWLSYAFETWASRSPADAATYLADLPSAPAPSVVHSAVAGWVSSDVQAAADWVGLFPPGETRDDATQAIVAYWGNNDPASAAKWLDSIGADASSEALLGQLWLFRDEPAARAWVQSTSMPDEQKQQLIAQHH